MVVLSASKIKTLNTCSWLFYCNYHLKTPRTSNDGARRGTVTHLLLECLLNPRHKHHYDTILNKGITASKACERLVRKSMKKEGIVQTLEGEDHFQMICDFVNVALNYDFFMEGFTREVPEYAFDIKTDDFHIIGFLDKIGFKGDVCRIVDYKTSKTKPTGEDKTWNIQALMYQVAVQILWPNVKKSFVDFLYLKFKRAPKEVFSGSNKALKGFVEYLKYLTEYLKDFGMEKAVSNFAANDYLKKNLCGTLEDRFKDDGSPKWRCPQMLPYDYWVLVNDEGKIAQSSLEKDELPGKEGYRIEKRAYLGCPAFLPQNYRKK
jgi:hypothetical protein